MCWGDAVTDSSSDSFAWAHPTLTGLGPRRHGIVGALDAFTAPSIEPALRELVEARGIVVLDLSRVGVLTSGGLAMVERIHACAAGLGQDLTVLATEGGLVHQVLRFSQLPAQSIRVEPDAADPGPALPD